MKAHPPWCIAVLQSVRTAVRVPPAGWQAVLGTLLAWATLAGGQAIAQAPELTKRPNITSDERPHVGLSQRVDNVFASVVSAMETVLFHRIGADQRRVVVTDHVEYYVRDRVTDPTQRDQVPFVRIGPADPSRPNQLTRDEARALMRQKRVLAGPYDENDKRVRVYLLGLLTEPNGATKPIEYVTYTVDVGAKYVWLDDDQKFHRLLPKRSLLGMAEGDLLTREQVDAMGAAGILAVDPTKAARGDPPYILTETDQNTGVPFVVGWLAMGALGFTIYFRGLNLWGFRHAIDVIRGRYDNPADAGEVTHFQALASALSATVGLGNISGVTIAMTTGGPGAFLWMILCGVLGMTSKFVECSQGVKYRLVKPDGTVQGGPMRYLSIGLGNLGWPKLGAVLAFAFTVMCILASFGGGNMYQANQSGEAVLALLQTSDNQKLEALSNEMDQAAAAGDLAKMDSLQSQLDELNAGKQSFGVTFRVVFGVILAAMVGVVIVGGIRRIGAAAEKIVPFMCGTYMLACLYIILKHIDRVPELTVSIFDEALTADAFGGGLLGVAVIGIQRAAFSNEAGVGSASIAHSAAKTDEPIREGVVALIEPFIDTVIVCSMTALVILITGAWDNDLWVVTQGLSGSSLTSKAFGAELSWFPVVLALATVLFAYSTIISWSYYGERCWEQLFGPRLNVVYKVLTLIGVVVGSIVNLGSVLGFSDMMILAMAFPNILGLLFLAPGVRRDLLEYWDKYRSGKFKRYF